MVRINLRSPNPSKRSPWIFRASLLLSALLLGHLSGAHEMIIGGEIAKVAEFPGVVLLKMSESGGVGAMGWEGSCTGFLVHPKLILTAAHCLQGHTHIDSISNGVKGSGKDSAKFREDEINSRPDFVLPSSDRTDAQRKEAASKDIGYVVLREEIPADVIAPIEIYVTSDSPSMNRLANLDATLVGYGATRWEKSGNYEGASTGTKKIGHKKITDFENGFIRLAGAEGGALPGDSGGPILATIDGKLKVVALNHGMTPEQKQKTDKHGNPKFDKKGAPIMELTGNYGATIGTMLTKDNLCWVERTAKIDLPGVECAN